MTLKDILKLNSEVVANSPYLDYSEPDQLVFDFVDKKTGELKESRALFTHYIDNNLVGMVGLRLINKQTAKLKLLRVASAYRNQGVATKLIKQVENYCKKHSITNLILSVDSLNEAAIKLYEKLGFKKVGEEEMITDNGVKILVYSYRLSYH